MLVCMRTTLTLDDDLLEEAQELTGLKEISAIVQAGLEALIAQESARRLAGLGGFQEELESTPRRRPNWS